MTSNRWIRLISWCLLLSKITSAVAWAVAIANDPAHGYDQHNRWGPDYDCSSLVIQAWENAGVKVKTAGATYTGNMKTIFLANGFEDVTSQINLSTGSGLKKGDVVLNISNHTEMVYNDSGHLVGARISENGTIYAGQEGDQTGEEILVRGYYYNYPWDCVLRYTAEDEPEIITPISSNHYLTTSQMQVNAKYIYRYFKGKGWTDNAIAGMLGNMQRESTINPGIWQSLNEGNMSGGFGLVQWTPATNLIDWANSNGLTPSAMDTQLKRIEYELANGLQYYKTDSYPLSFKEFTQSTQSPEYLASAFLHNYERAGVPAEDERRTNARYWYDYLIENGGSGETPDIPIIPDTPTKKHKMSLMLMYMATRRRF